LVGTSQSSNCRTSRATKSFINNMYSHVNTFIRLTRAAVRPCHRHTFCTPIVAHCLSKCDLAHPSLSSTKLKFKANSL
jgi:hypothetical protein